MKASGSSAGLAIGLLVSTMAMRALAGLLFEISPTDPATFAAVTAGLGVVALAARYVPARRAARIDPAIVLRDD